MRAGTRRAWPWLLAASVALVGAADAVVLDLARGYFGTGYNGVALRAPGEIAAFFAGGAVLDLAAVGFAWCCVLPLARALGARPLRALAVSTVAGVALPLAFDLIRHRLHRVLGDVLELSLLLDLAAGSWRNALGEASQDLPPLALLGAAGGGSAALAFVALGLLERRYPRLRTVELPRTLRLASLSACAGVLAVGLIAFGSKHLTAVENGWSEKPAGRVLRSLVSAITDVDRDGYGWLSSPADPSPLDAAVHPYAVEIPGNGIDENGIGGDLPPGTQPPRPVPVPTPRPNPTGPSVLLVFLESFRADLLGRTLDGRAVTPNLDALARQGTHATAYAHLPLTWAARGSLLQGRVVPLPRASTLIDDFIARGYEVAWFSGQHDGLAEQDVRLGLERVTSFYDARADIPRRTSRSAQPISLQVSWKTVLGRVRDYLDARKSRAPLFLYVNIVDTHFPYWHRELDEIVMRGSLPREAIGPANRERVWLSYLNAAANVDRAIGAIESVAREKLGSSLRVIVTGDHGQSFYEDGLLGHGQSLDESQSAVPFVASVASLPLPHPLALSDVRGLLGHWLDGKQPPASALARKEIFQHVGAIDRVVLVGLRGESGVEVAELTHQGELTAARAIHTWEASLREFRNAKRRQP
jgi:hypothetical protein